MVDVTAPAVRRPRCGSCATLSARHRPTGIRSPRTAGRGWSSGPVQAPVSSPTTRTAVRDGPSFSGRPASRGGGRDRASQGIGGPISTRPVRTFLDLVAALCKGSGATFRPGLVGHRLVHRSSPGIPTPPTGLWKQSVDEHSARTAPAASAMRTMTRSTRTTFPAPSRAIRRIPRLPPLGRTSHPGTTAGRAPSATAGRRIAAGERRHSRAGGRGGHSLWITRAVSTGTPSDRAVRPRPGPRAPPRAGRPAPGASPRTRRRRRPCRPPGGTAPAPAARAAPASAHGR